MPARFALILAVLLMPACGPTAETTAPDAIDATPAAALVRRTPTCNLSAVRTIPPPSEAQFLCLALIDKLVDDLDHTEIQVRSDAQDRLLKLWGDMATALIQPGGQNVQVLIDRFAERVREAATSSDSDAAARAQTILERTGLDR